MHIVCSGLVCSGLVRSGLVLYGKLRGSVASCGLLWCVLWCGVASHGMAW